MGRETAVFVLTNGDTGIERERDGEHATIEPGKGYRAITVATDRRVIVLVGNAEDGGDKRVTLPLVEVTDAGHADGALVLTTPSGVRAGRENRPRGDGLAAGADRLRGGRLPDHP